MARSVETSLLLTFLRRAHAANEIATYQAMSEHIHADVQTKERWKLHSALQILARDEDLHFEVVQNVGYKPLSNAVLSEVVSRNRQAKIKSHTRRWRNELESVNTNSLSQDELKEHTKNLVKLNAQEYVVAPETNKRLEEVAMNTSGVEHLKAAISALSHVRT